jgi:hypothetical protein
MMLIEGLFGLFASVTGLVFVAANPWWKRWQFLRMAVRARARAREKRRERLGKRTLSHVSMF